MSQNLKQSTSINLSAIFHEVVHPLKAASLIPDPGICFNNAAYGDCLVQLGKFLSLVESLIAINFDSQMKQSPVLVSYANAFNKSIKILRHSLWFLQSVPTIEDEKKFSIFQNSIDIFDNALSVIDETIKIFFSDEVISVLQKELRSNLLWLYDCCLKNSPFFNIGTIDVHSNSASVHKVPFTEETSGNNSPTSESKNVSPKINSEVTLPGSILINKRSSSRKNSGSNAGSTVIPISCQENITFSDLGHKKRFDQICKRIKDDLNYFAIVKSRKLKLKCLLCDVTMFAAKVESHVILIDHLREKSKAPCFNTVSNLAVRETWDLTQNSAVTPGAHAKVLKSDSSPISEYPSQMTGKVSDTSGNTTESYKPLSPTANLKNITFSDPSHKKRFDEICTSIKDEVYHFSIVKSKKLKLKCLFCDCTVHASKVEDHVSEVSHLQRKSKALGLRTEPDSASSTNLDYAQKNAVTPVACISEPKPLLSPQILGNSSQLAKEVPDVSENIQKSCSLFDMSRKTINVLDHSIPHNTDQSCFKRILNTSSSSALISIPLEKDFIFADRAHKKRFKEICKNIKDEVNYFKIIKAKQLKLWCKLCDQTVPASKVEHHIIEMSHLRKKSKTLGISTSSDSASSPNCDTAQTNPSFESDTSAPDTLPNSSGNHQCSGKAPDAEETAEHIPKSSKTSNSSSKTNSNTSTCTNGLNTNWPSSRCNTAPHNLVTPESVVSIPGSNLWSDLSEKSLIMAQNAAVPENSLSSETKSDSTFSHNFIPISCEEYFTLSKEQQKQFDRLCGLIGCQINYFLVRQSKGFKLKCLLCNQTMKASSVVGHVSEQGHLLNASLQKTGPSSVPERCSEKAAALSEENKKFLVYFSRSCDFFCKLCNLVLYPTKDEWFEHFHGEYHNARLPTIDTSHAENVSVDDFKRNVDQEVAKNIGVKLNIPSYSKIMDQTTAKNLNDILTTQKRENVESSRTKSQEISESELSQFARSSHEKEFLRLKEKLNDQMENFSVQSEPNQKKLKMTCNLCKECMQASSVETHVKEREHSQHVIASQVKEEHKKYLEFCPSDRGYRCIVCKETLSGSTSFLKVLWHGHFESEAHRRNEEKLSRSISSFLNVQTNLSADLPTKCELVSMKKKMSNDLKSEQQNLHDETKENLASSPKNISSAVILSNSVPVPAIPSTQKLNLEAFKFSKYSHSTEFVSLIKQINNQVAYFTILSLAESEKLKLLCRPCQKSISTLSEAVEHVKKQNHLRNLTKCHFFASVMPAISNQDWSFLEPRPMFEDFFCSLCNKQLLSKYSSWVEHFQGKSHKSKSQSFIASDSKGSCGELPSVFENSAATDKKFKGAKKELSLSKQSATVNSNLAPDHGYVSKKTKNSSKSASRVIFALSSSTPTFPKFKQSSYVLDYQERQDEVKYHKKLFSIEDEGGKKKHIMVCCNLCDKGMSVNNIDAHMNSKTHLHNCNAVEILISVEDRMFLDLRSGCCTLCDVPLHQNQLLWLQHLRSEFHNNLKSQTLHTKKKDTVSTAVKRVEPVMPLNGFSKTNTNSSLPSPASKQRSCQSAAINFDFAPNFIDIFTEIDSLESTQLKTSSPSTSKPDPPEFKHKSHAQQYLKLCNQIKGQIKHFAIASDQKTKNLEMICKSCNILIAAKSLKCHITSPFHLRRLMVPFVSEGNRKFLHDVGGLRCLLCNVRLFKNDRLWIRHFQSQSHILKLKKYNDNNWSSRVGSGLKTLLKCEKVYGNCVQTTGPRSHPISNAEIKNIVTYENSTIRLNANNQPNAKLSSLEKNRGNGTNFIPEKSSAIENNFISSIIKQSRSGTNVYQSPGNLISNTGMKWAKQSEITSTTSCKTVNVSSSQNHENLSELADENVCKNALAKSETFKYPGNFIEMQNGKGLVPSNEVITGQSNLIKTSVLPSLKSFLASKQEFSHPKQSIAIDFYFAQNYVNIFAKDNNSLNLILADASESQFKLNLSEFKENSHKKEYDALCGQIGGQVWLFTVNSAPQRKLKLTCKICNKLMSFKRVVCHVSCIEHLANLLAPFMNEESKMYLGRFRTVYCTLCDIPLYNKQCLWFKHFQSELHNLKLQEHHDDFWSLKVDSYPKMLEENKKINADYETSTNSGQIQSNLSGNFEVSRFASREDNSTVVNPDIKLPAGPGSLAMNDKKENLSCIQNHVNILKSVRENDCENVSSNTKIFKIHKNVIEDKGKIGYCASGTMMSVESIPHQSIFSKNSVKSSLEPLLPEPLTYFKKSTVTDVDFTQNYVDIFAKTKGSDSSSPEVLKLSLPDFKQDAHKRQYEALLVQIGDQIRYFSFICEPQKKLRMTCMLCIRSMNFKKASSHIKCYDHLSNLMAPYISKESKMYLGKHSKTICCSLCNVPLYVNRCLWFEHFQSEFHLSKLQEYHNGHWSLQIDSSSKKSAKSENFDTNHLKHTNYGLKAGNNLTCKSNASDSNVNFGWVTNLGISAENDKNYSLLNSKNHSNLLEAGSEDASNLSTRESSSKYVYDLTTLKFAQYLHSIQFMRLIQKVNDQVNHFSFESHPESRDLKFICKVCKESFTNADMAASHVKMQKHKLNSGLFNSSNSSVPAIEGSSWMFLKPCLLSKGFRCTWCNVKLSSEFSEWMDHFQSESHNFRLDKPPTASNFNTNSEVVPDATSAEKNTGNSVELRNEITPELCVAPPIPLENALDADFIQATKKFDKEKLETFIAELDFQVNFFLIYSTKFEEGRIKLICKLCARSLALHKVADHIESRDHFQNMITPLISKESRIYLDWCDVTRHYSCSLCRITLSRGTCLFEHFQSDAHMLKLQDLDVSDGNSKHKHVVKCSTGSEDFKFNEELVTDCPPTPAPSSFSTTTPVDHSDLSAEINVLSRTKKMLKLYRNKHIFKFLHLACSVEDQVNFFSFEAGPEDLNMICQLCKVSFTEVEFAIHHVEEKKHTMNVERNKKEIIVVPWIPSVCDDNWKFVWPFPDLRNYFCTVCSRMLPKPVLSWVHHFRSKSHNQKLKELHQDLLTAETCFLSSGNKDEDWALGTLTPENLFQDSFDLKALQFSTVSHKIQFENLAKKINYQINYFSISVQKQSNELILMCKVCNETVFVSEAEEHVNGQAHLLNLAVKCERKPDTHGSEISQDDWQYLDFSASSQEYICTLCDVHLSSSKESWAEHFQSKVHRLLAEEPQITDTLPAEKRPASESIKCSDTCLDDEICVLAHSENDQIIEHFLEETDESKIITNKLCLTNSSPFKSTNHFEKFINKCEEIVSKLSSPELKKTEKPKFVFSLSSPEIGKPEKPEEIFDLSSVFRFFKIEDYFTSFFDLTRFDKRVLKENCKFILIDEKSQEVFCTACHCFNSVKNDPRSLKNLIGHFLGSQHENNFHSYGPAAFFQYNVSLMKFFNGKSGFCSLCSVTISCCLPADVDLLLDHFESQKHADLVCKMYEKESDYAEKECVTLVLKPQ